MSNLDRFRAMSLLDACEYSDDLIGFATAVDYVSDHRHVHAESILTGLWELAFRGEYEHLEDGGLSNGDAFEIFLEALCESRFVSEGVMVEVLNRFPDYVTVWNPDRIGFNVIFDVFERWQDVNRDVAEHIFRLIAAGVEADDFLLLDEQRSRFVVVAATM